MSMSNLKANEVAALAELKHRLGRDFGLVDLRLFGSKARGDSHSESDIDVLVVLENCDWATEKAVYDLCLDVGFDHHVFIAPLLYSRADYESSLTRATDIYESVAREGVPV